MAAEINYVLIGHTQKSRGLTGELKLFIESAFIEDFLKNERIFIDIKGKKIPYFIENVRGTQNLIFKLEDVDDRDAAYALQSREVFLRQQDILADHERELETEEEGLEYGHLVGYLLHDATLGEIGPITEVLDMPQQEMAFLTWKKREVLIPINAGLIVRIDEDQKAIWMDLPEGLLDV